MRQLRYVALLACALLALPGSPARATSLVRARSVSDVDWVSAGIGGVPAGSANLTLAGVTGTVKKAFLYWNGLNRTGQQEIYDNPTVAINGYVVSGTSLGDTSTNCWAYGSTRAYVAEVTPYVTGDGTYALSGLATQPAYEVNGASLVVLFDDGDRDNNRDLIFFEGNDGTNIEKTWVTEDRGWHVTLEDIVYKGGNVYGQFHVADGQSVNDGDDGRVTFRGPRGDLTIENTTTLWDGQSVPLQGTSRSPGDALWDIHTLDLSRLFTAAATYTLYLDSDRLPADCIALVALIIDLAPASGPAQPICGNGIRTADEGCDDGNRTDGDCCDGNCQTEPAGTVCGNPGDPCLESRCDGTGTCDVDGRTCRMPIAAEEGRLVLKHGRQDQLIWEWTSGVSTLADFGDPLETTYDLCVTDKGTGSVRLLMHEIVSPDASCSRPPCWSSTGTAYRYRNPAGPLQQLTLQGGRPGEAKIFARSGGGGFAMPPMPLAPPVSVRLWARDGLCWGVNFSLPRKNSSRRFRSRGDAFYPH